METGEYILRKTGSTDDIPFGLLLLADETKDAIEKYIYESDIYTFLITSNQEPLGVFALVRLNDTTIEIKNIAVLESFRGMGIGRILVSSIKEIARKEGYSEIIVGTADTGTREILFYERNGFIKYGTRKDFFINNYPEPIIENGVMLKDMVMLKAKVQ